MADNRTKAGPVDDASEQQAVQPVNRADQQAGLSTKFATADLIARSNDFLGQPSYVTAGALHGVDGDLTIDDAQARIKDWLQKPVEEA